MQILNLDAIAKSEQPNPDVAPSEVGFVKGKTLYINCIVLLISKYSGAYEIPNFFGKCFKK